jgi:SulP family sulfate permease
MVVNGSLSKTAVNDAAGAGTELSGLLVAALTILTLLFLTGRYEQLPEATLAAIVIAAVIELVDFPALASLYRAGVRLLLAHVGQVRDVLATAGEGKLDADLYPDLPSALRGAGVRR